MASGSAEARSPAPRASRSARRCGVPLPANRTTSTAAPSESTVANERSKASARSCKTVDAARSLPLVHARPAAATAESGAVTPSTEATKSGFPSVP